MFKTDLENIMCLSNDDRRGHFGRWHCCSYFLRMIKKNLPRGLLNVNCKIKNQKGSRSSFRHYFSLMEYQCKKLEIEKFLS